MGWKTTGEARVKSFKVYQDLEKRYLDLQKDKERLEEMVRAKDRSIQSLAQELATAMASSEPELTQDSVPPTEGTDTLPDTERPSRPIQGPGIRKASGTIQAVTLPLKDRLGGSR